MTFVPRSLEPNIKQLMEWFPVVSVTGPRQSGKSTLLKEMFPQVPYVTLEDTSLREIVAEDPIGFLRANDSPFIIDEAQYVPELFSAVQIVSDEKNTPGQYILSGSQNFLLLKSITQSLAGRVGITHLLPLAFSEATAAQPDIDVESFMILGGYPRMYNVDIPPAVYFENYINTYVERDVTELLGVRDAVSFRKFLVACATQAGNLIQYSTLANELDVDFKTIKRWVSILESSFVVFELPAYHANVRKTLTKTPKLYFYDTGLLCHLLGIRTFNDWIKSPFRGAIFENLIVAETAKWHMHSGRRPELYFYRDDSKREIDLLDFTEGRQQAVEIKASPKYEQKHVRHLVAVSEELGIQPGDRHVVYRGDYASQTANHTIIPARKYLSF